MATPMGNSSFLSKMQSLQNQELGSQYALAQQQQQFNDTMQKESEYSHESATLQQFSQDITNARNTLTSSDLQQIK